MVYPKGLAFVVGEETVYNTVTIGPGGRIWGLSRDGIFRIDSHPCFTALVARPPEGITTRFALEGRDLHYASGASIYRRTLPAN